MARPTEYNFELCMEVCDLVRQGANIKEVLSSKKEYPSFPTWCKWKRENMELFNLYINAIHDKSESCISRIDEILKKVENGEMTEKVGRLLIYAEQWKASKYYPKMFGKNSSIDITSDGKEVSQQVTIFQLPDNNR